MEKMVGFILTNYTYFRYIGKEKFTLYKLNPMGESLSVQLEPNLSSEVFPVDYDHLKQHKYVSLH